MTKDYAYVKLYTDAHEYGYSKVNFSSKDKFRTSKMDMFNNSVGRYQASLGGFSWNSAYNDIQRKILSVLYDGGLEYQVDGGWKNEDY